jgi:deoxycytidylate deaminase
MKHFLFQDKFYQECIHYALQSKGKQERYGALVVHDGEILGGGYNRAIAHPAWSKKLERVIRQGHTNHAEIEALNDTVMNNTINVVGADIYVAGYFQPTKQIFFQNKFTCVRCPPILKKYGIKNIYIPSINGWKKRPIDEALEEAKDYLLGGTTQNRLESCQGNFILEDFYQINF